MVITPSASPSPAAPGDVSSGWTRRISKTDIYPSSLDAIRARAAALRRRWRDHSAAGVVPVSHATCSPLYLRLEADEALTLELLGPFDEYESCSAPLGERDAARCVHAVAHLLSRLHAEGVVHGHLHSGVVWRREGTAPHVVVTECELPMSALVPHGVLGGAARRCAAPEILRGDPYTGAADVWGLAVLLVQLRLGPQRPLCTADLQDSDLLSPVLSALGPGVASLALPCLKSDPHARPLLLEVLQHPFFAFAARIGDEDTDDEEDVQSSSDEKSTSEEEATTPSNANAGTSASMRQPS
ncbi:protein kinase [Novymonas esmeraldas]|uniref:non-specific serine/threonine protein kinase n=1 Tax=Novymonas esmeraldas TaxID=1808958 RepID=A0AAW0F6Q4_9TRYP